MSLKPSHPATPFIISPIQISDHLRDTLCTLEGATNKTNSTKQTQPSYTLWVTQL